MGGNLVRCIWSWCLEGHHKGLVCCGYMVVLALSNGGKVRSWLDKWCGDNSLKNAFPSLFVLATFKEAWVEEV